MHWWNRWNVRTALTLFVAAFVLGTFGDIGRVRPAQENESAFLRSFNLHEIITRFELGEALSRSEGAGSGSGYGYATHNRVVEEFFFVKNGDQFAADTALQQDVRTLLKVTGATLVEESATSSGGRAFHYVVGKTSGTVVVEPVSTENWTNGRMPKDGVPVRARVSIEEKWSKSQPATSASVASLR
jgi:hypothetical protein